MLQPTMQQYVALACCDRLTMALGHFSTSLHFSVMEEREKRKRERGGGGGGGGGGEVNMTDYCKSATGRKHSAWQ